ncbi:metallophosphoesterase [Anaerosalibacter massiliensis]|uniref:Metallophosphoesterase n=1 Tax=Anaerosalibacter massiliensis TaxID=1347392 RepID=A0A9X2MI72_9FIRM|nr:metallophosphoesterase [Anaerosalibacter massiliensis]MCR2044510.1 metallophosphoesterase [Anaerosalibacter massiliensis]
MSFKNKKILKLILCAVFTVCIFLFFLEDIILAQANQIKGIKKITILHTNDMHGRVLEEKDSGMGFSKMNTKIKEIRKKNPNTILLDVGDAIQGSEIATNSKGESIIKLMNAMKYDGMAVGNHEFDYGYKRLLEIRDMANFPLMTGNILNENGKNDFKPYIIKEVDGIKVGIFSVLTPDTQYATSPKNIKGISFLNPLIASNELVKELKEKDVDLIIGLTHLGASKKGKYSSIDIAKNIEGIDIIVDGHSHKEMNMKVEDTLIVQSGKYTENLGIIDIKFLGNKIISKKASLFTKKEGDKLKEDREIKALINEIIEENKSKTKETIGKSKKKTYIVKSGDVLFRIGKKYGIGWMELAEFNKIKNPNKIYPGDIINIPIK